MIVAHHGAGDVDRDVAGGLVAFVPLAPLPQGAQLEARWQLPAEMLPPDRQFPGIAFTVQ